MTSGEVWILEELTRWGPLTAQELLDSDPLRDHRTRQGKAAKLVQLEQRGFVRRCGDVSWEITDSGREVLAQ
jgi:repressor of nif and glnA expression